MRAIVILSLLLLPSLALAQGRTLGGGCNSETATCIGKTITVAEKIFGVWATPQSIDMNYGGNGMKFATGGVAGGDFYFTDVGGNPYAHISNNGLLVTARAAGALPTCNSDRQGLMVPVTAAGGTRTKLCLCTSDGGGTPAFAWQNMASEAVGTDTTCG